MTISLPLNLSAANVTAAENDGGLVSVSPDGLAITTGNYNSGGGDTNLDPLTLGKNLGGLADPSGNNLTTAEFDGLHLVKGETLSITYNYSWEDLEQGLLRLLHPRLGHEPFRRTFDRQQGGEKR